MISTLRTLSTRLAIPFTLSMALCVAGTAQVQAAGVYAYSRQTLSGFGLTGATLSGLTTKTTAATTLNGTGPSFSNPTDTPQAFQGDSAYNLGPNKFGQNGAPGANTFTRGDALISTSGGGSASTVAESSLQGFGTATGDSTFSLTSSFRLGQRGAVALDFDYLNSVIVDFAGSYLGYATANYKSNLTIEIKGSNGDVVFDESPDEINLALSLTSAGHETGGTSSHYTFTTQDLDPDTYTITLSGASSTALSQAVPEPSSVILMGCGVMAAVGFAARRARRKGDEA